MTKKLSLFLLGGFLLLLLGCRADEAYFQSSDNIAYTNRSLWQEDEMFIRIVKAVYEENKESINPTNEEVEWDYAMTMGLEDRSLVLVPVVSNNVVQYILEVRRKGEKVFFVKNYELKRRKFFQALLFGEYIRREESKSMSSRLECVTRTISTWKPDDERYPDPETGNGRWESTTVIDCQVLDEDRCYGIVDQFGVCTNTGGGGYDLPPNWDIEGGGSGGGNPNPKNTPPNNDPCAKAKNGVTKANEFYKKGDVKNAQTKIIEAAKNGKENMIAFGSKTLNGTVESTGVQEGNIDSGVITNPYAYPIADIHNHPNNKPPSTGDVYSMMKYHLQYNTFSTRYVLSSDGTLYALVVTDAQAIREFLSKYPPYQAQSGLSLNFPDKLFDEWVDIKNDFSESGALAYILNKYNAGVSLTKMDRGGAFRNINIKEISTSDGVSYAYELCP